MFVDVELCVPGICVHADLSYGVSDGESDMRAHACPGVFVPDLTSVRNESDRVLPERFHHKGQRRLSYHISVRIAAHALEHKICRALRQIAHRQLLGCHRGAAGHSIKCGHHRPTNILPRWLRAGDELHALDRGAQHHRHELPLCCQCESRVHQGQRLAATLSALLGVVEELTLLETRQVEAVLRSQVPVPLPQNHLVILLPALDNAQEAVRLLQRAQQVPHAQPRALPQH